jgi:hypothetical protein
MPAHRVVGARARWIVVGLGLMLLAAPIGDARDLLSNLLGWWASTRKYTQPFGFDRALGRLVLILGWYCIARGLGGDGGPSNPAAGSFSRLSFRLRWLPVPLLATMGLYVALVLREADTHLLVINVSNLPPDTKLLVGGNETVTAWNENRYAEAIEYLFGVPRGRAGWLPTFQQAHAEFRSEPTRLGLQNWHPEWTWLFITSNDEATHQGLVVFLNLRSCAGGAEIIDVGKSSAVPCSDWYEDSGRCVVQNAYYRQDAEQIRVNVDLAGLQPESYQGDFPFRLDSNLGAKWQPCPSAANALPD